MLIHKLNGQLFLVIQIFPRFLYFVLYKNLFLRKNLADHVRHLIWPEWNPKLYGTEKLPPLFCRELLLRSSVWIRGPNWRQEKLVGRLVSSLASWIADTYFEQAEGSQEIKVKLNESRLLKVKQLKENSTENSAENNFKEDSQLNKLWNVSTKQKTKNKKKKRRKEKYSNSKNFVSRILSQISSSKLH